MKQRPRPPIQGRSKDLTADVLEAELISRHRELDCVKTRKGALVGASKRDRKKNLKHLP